MKSLAKRWWFWLIVVIAAVFLVVHTYLAIWVRDYVNRKLSEIPGYRAHAAAVTLHLWRGAYQIHDIEIKKTDPTLWRKAQVLALTTQANWAAFLSGSGRSTEPEDLRFDIQGFTNLPAK